MASSQLNISIIQPDIVWEDKEANLKQYEEYINGIKEKKEVVVLPEMFSTGFSMNPPTMAELPYGATVNWMQEQSKKHHCIITGSVIIEEEGNYYNRLLWVQPDGQIGHYDKRHLFGYADEDKHYTAGNKRLIVSVKGIKICLLVCYDLRFPVWARNKHEEYDVLLYVANWPARRAMAWETLLKARAIENMSYCIGVNRIGSDANDIEYNGGSVVFDPLGATVWQHFDDAICHTVTIDQQNVIDARAQFQFLNDADDFMITD